MKIVVVYCIFFPHTKRLFTSTAVRICKTRGGMPGAYVFFCFRVVIRRAAAYFARGNYNIIIVDYSSLAQIPCLSQVEWAPRFCGMCIAQLANYLAEHPRGVPPDRLHMMG